MKKKILFVIGMFAGGGAEKVLINMVNQMDTRKYDITIYCVFDTGRKPELKDSIKIYYTFKVGKDTNDTIKKKRKIAKFMNAVFTYGWKFMPMRLFYKWVIRERYDYEVAYAEGIPHKIIAASVNKESRKYGWIHIDMSVHKRATEFFRSRQDELNCYNKMDKLVFVSDYARKSFIDKYGSSYIAKSVTKYNLNENDKIIEKSKEFLRDIPSVRPLLVTVGRLHDQKGYDRLLRACRDIQSDVRAYEIWIIGDGDRHEILEEFIKKNGLKERVKLKGFQDNPYKYIEKADWFIAPSRYEGFSTVVSEAYILEKPVMVTDCSGMDELTDNGEYGIIVKNTEEGIRDGLIRILNMKASEYMYYKKKAVDRKMFFNTKNRLEDIYELFES